MQLDMNILFVVENLELVVYEPFETVIAILFYVYFCTFSREGKVATHPIWDLPKPAKICILYFGFAVRKISRISFSETKTRSMKRDAVVRGECRSLSRDSPNKGNIARRGQSVNHGTR